MNSGRAARRGRMPPSPTDDCAAALLWRRVHLGGGCQEKNHRYRLLAERKIVNTDSGNVLGETSSASTERTKQGNTVKSTQEADLNPL